MFDRWHAGRVAENQEPTPGSLAQRLGWDRTDGAPARPRPAATRVRAPGRRRAGRGEPPGRHCWVVDCPEAPGRWPGLLLEWVRERDGWRGKVVMIAEGDLGPVTLVLWVAGEHLQPT